MFVGSVVVLLSFVVVAHVGACRLPLLLLPVVAVVVAFLLLSALPLLLAVCCGGWVCCHPLALLRCSAVPVVAVLLFSHAPFVARCFASSCSVVVVPAVVAAVVGAVCGCCVVCVGCLLVVVCRCRCFCGCCL